MPSNISRHSFILYLHLITFAVALMLAHPYPFFQPTRIRLLEKSCEVEKVDALVPGLADPAQEFKITLIAITNQSSDQSLQVSFFPTTSDIVSPAPDTSIIWQINPLNREQQTRVEQTHELRFMIHWGPLFNHSLVQPGWKTTIQFNAESGCDSIRIKHLIGSIVGLPHGTKMFDSAFWLLVTIFLEFLNQITGIKFLEQLRKVLSLL